MSQVRALLFGTTSGAYGSPESGAPYFKDHSRGTLRVLLIKLGRSPTSISNQRATDRPLARQAVWSHLEFPEPDSWWQRQTDSTTPQRGACMMHRIQPMAAVTQTRHKC